MSIRDDWEPPAVLVGLPVLASISSTVTWWHVALLWLMVAAVLAGWYWRPHVALPQLVPQVTDPRELDRLFAVSVAREQRAAEQERKESAE